MSLHRVSPFQCIISSPLIGADGKVIENSSDFKQAVEENFNEIFIVTPEGYFKFHRLRAGAGGKSRFVQVKVDSLPKGIKQMTLKDHIDFLPDGKVPVDLLEQVRQFFRDVISKKGKALEAMIWVLWNQEQGYHLFVPNQRVGHASASYDWTCVPEGSSVIVDIHSHADFSAFFSGTDNADDSNSIRYSMVIGNNDKPGLDYKARFNYFSKKIDVTVHDIFEEPVKTIEIPEGWMDKVTTAYVSPMVNNYGYRGHYQGQTHYQGHSASSLPPETSSRKSSKWSASSSVSSQKEVDKETLGKGSAEVVRLPTSTSTQQSTATSNTPATAGGAAEVSGNQNTGNSVVDSHLDALSDELSAFGIDPYNFQYPAAGEAVEKKATAPSSIEVPTEERCNRVFNNDPFREIGNDFEVREVKLTKEVMASIEDAEGVFDSVAINHGVEAATSYITIIANIKNIEGEAALIGNLCNDMFSTLPPEGQMSVFKDLWNNLDGKCQESIQTNGL